MSDGAATSSISLAIDTKGVSTGVTIVKEELGALKAALSEFSNASGAQGISAGRSFAQGVKTEMGQSAASLLVQAASIGKSMGSELSSGFGSGFAALSAQIGGVKSSLDGLHDEVRKVNRTLADLRDTSTRTMGATTEATVGTSKAMAELVEKFRAGEITAKEFAAQASDAQAALTASLGRTVRSIDQATAAQTGLNAKLLQERDLDAMLAKAKDDLARRTMEQVAANLAYEQSEAGIAKAAAVAAAAADAEKGAVAALAAFKARTLAANASALAAQRAKETADAALELEKQKSALVAFAAFKARTLSENAAALAAQKAKETADAIQAFEKEQSAVIAFAAFKARTLANNAAALAAQKAKETENAILELEKQQSAITAFAAFKARTLSDNAAALAAQRAKETADAALELEKQQSALTAFAAFKVRTLAANAAALAAQRAKETAEAALELEKQQSAITAFAAFKARTLADNAAALAAQRAKETADAALELEKQQSAIVAFAAFRARTMADNAAALAAQRAKETADAIAELERQRAAQIVFAAFKARTIAENAAAERKAIEDIAAARKKAEEANFLKNHSFDTSSIAQQLNLANRAQDLISKGRPDLANEMYGSKAGLADRAALTRELEKTGKAARDAAGGLMNMNHAMKEGHSLARGLAGPLGMMWLTWGSLAPLLAGAALAASIKGVVENGKELEYHLTFVTQLTNGATIATHEFAEAMHGSQLTTKEGALGLRALAQAGLDATSALQVLPQVLNLAVVGEMSVAQAALAATGVMHAFGLSIFDIGRVSDVFAKAAAISNTSVIGMTESMKTASIAADLYGVSLEETSAALVILAKRNISGTAAGTSLRNMMGELAAPIGKAAERMKQLGMQMYDDQGNLKTFTEQLKELQRTTAGLNEQSRFIVFKELFGERGIKSAAALTKEMELYGETVETLKDKSKGFTDGVVKALNGTVQGQWKRTANELSLSFDEAFAHTADGWSNLVSQLTRTVSSQNFKDFVEGVSGGFLKLTRLLTENSTAIAVMVATLYTARTAWAAYTAYQAAATAATAALAAGTGTATTALAGLRAVLATVAWPVAIVTALGAAYYYLAGGIDEVAEAEDRRANNAKSLAEQTQAEIKRLNTQREILALMVNENLSLAEAQERVANAQRKGQGSDDSLAKDRVTKAMTALAAWEKTYKGSDFQSTDTGYQEWNKLNQERLKAEKALEDQKKRDMGATKDSKELRVATEATELAKRRLDLTKKVEDAERQIARMQGAGIKSLGPLSTEFSAFKTGLPKVGSQVLNDETLDEAEARFDALQKKISGFGTVVSPLNDPNKDSQKKHFDSTFNALKKNFEDEENLRQLNQKSEMASIEEQRKFELLNLSDYLAKKRALTEKDQADRKANINNLRVGVDGLALPEKNKADYRTDVDTLLNSKERDRELAKRQEDAVTRGKVLSETNRILGASYEYLNRTLPDMKAAQARAQANELEALSLDQMAQSTSPLIQQQYAVIVAQNQVREAYSKKRDEIGRELSLIDLEIKANQDVVAQYAENTEEANSAAEALRVLTARKAAYLAMQSGNQGASALAVEQAGVDAGQINKLTAWNRELAKSRTLTDQLGDALAKAFGRGGLAFGNLIKAHSDGNAARIRLDKQYESARKKLDDEKIEDVEELNRRKNALSADEAEERLKLERQTNTAMASSAKGLFEEKTAAHKFFAGMEMAFHLQRMGLAAIQLAKDNAMTGSSIANSLMRGAANVAEGVSKIFAMLGPWGFPVAAAMLAVVAKFGLGGGSASGPTEQQRRQQGQGTGSVLGDEGDQYGIGTQKSESISKALDTLKDNSDITRPYTQRMMMSLMSIDSGINGLGSLLARSYGTSDLPFSSVKDSKTNGIAGNKAASDYLTHMTLGGPIGLLTGALKMPLGPIGNLLSPVVGKLMSTFVKSSTTVLDSGLRTDNQSLGSAIAGGVTGQSYLDTKVTSKSRLLGLNLGSSNNTQTAALGSEITNQFTRLVSNFRSGIILSGEALGVYSEEFVKRLDAIPVGISLSLQGLSAEEKQKEIEAVFSRLGDDLARGAFSGLSDFQRVGEGYLETMIRVASGVEVATSVMDGLGISAIKYTELVDKQAEDISSAIVKQSIMKVETPNAGALTNVGKLLETLSGTAEELADTYKVLVGLRSGMNNMGLGGQNMGLSTLQGAGGLSELESGLADFLDGFYSDSERLQVSTKNLTDQFAKLGISALPTSKEEFRAMVEALTKSTNVDDQKKAGGLLVLSEAVADLFSEREGTTDDSSDLTLRLMRAQGRDLEALNLERALELRNVTETEAAIIRAIHAAEDHAKTESLSIALMQAQGKDLELLNIQRAMELENLSATDALIVQATHTAQDWAKSAELNLEMLNAQGRSHEALNIQRAQELAALSETDKAIKRRTYAAQDAAKAMEMEISYLNAQGRSVEAVALKRKAELLAMDQSLRAFQQVIWATEDRKALMDERDKLLLTPQQQLDKERAAMSPADRAIFDQIQALKKAHEGLSAAYKKEEDAIQSRIKRLDSLIINQANFRDAQKLGDMSPLTPQQKYNEARAQYDRVLAGVRAGDETAMGNYEKVQSEFLKASREANASNERYQSDFEKVMADSEESSRLAGVQIDVAKASLEALNLQVAGLTEIKLATLSVADAIRNLQLAMGNQPGDIVGPPSPIEKVLTPQENSIDLIYQALLGRKAESAGLEYWLNALNNGESLAAIANFISQSAEYKAIHGSHASGLLRVPHDGYRAELHKDERVLTASEARDFSRYGRPESAPLVAEIRALRVSNEALKDEVQGLRDDQNRQAEEQIQATYDANNRAAEKVNDGSVKAAKTAIYAERMKATIV